MTKRFPELFARLQEQGHKAFIPFITLADPNFETSKLILDTLILSGADALELGLPFSDPLLDGEVIQQANNRALAAKNSTTQALELISYVRNKYPYIPIGVLCAANLIYAQGIDNFYRQAYQAGIDAVLIADLPIIHAQEFIPSAKKNNIQSVFICPPNADQPIIQQIAQLSEGYVYLVSRAGVTSADNSTIDKNIKNIITSLKHFNSAPIIQGFGISTPEKAKIALEYGVDGIFVGSAIVSIIENNLSNVKQMIMKITLFCNKMKKTCIKNA